MFRNLLYFINKVDEFFDGVFLLRNAFAIIFVWFFLFLMSLYFYIVTPPSTIFRYEETVALLTGVYFPILVAYKVMNETAYYITFALYFIYILKSKIIFLILSILPYVFSFFYIVIVYNGEWKYS